LILAIEEADNRLVGLERLPLIEAEKVAEEIAIAHDELLEKAG
jgi:hypothetical protein